LNENEIPEYTKSSEPIVYDEIKPPGHIQEVPEDKEHSIEQSR
jgi:hypothetical protein